MVTVTILQLSTIIPYFIIAILVSIFSSCPSDLKKSKMYSLLLTLFLLEISFYKCFSGFITFSHSVHQQQRLCQSNSSPFTCQIMSSPINLLRKLIWNNFLTYMPLNRLYKIQPTHYIGSGWIPCLLQKNLESKWWPKMKDYLWDIWNNFRKKVRRERNMVLSSIHIVDEQLPEKRVLIFQKAIVFRKIT